MKMLYYLLACNCAINQYDSVSQVNDTDSSLSLSSMQAMCIGREDYMYNFGTPQLHVYTGKHFGISLQVHATYLFFLFFL